MAAPLVLWDFDGTLACRPGLWSGCVIEMLDEHEPGHGLAREQVRAAMRGRYPWNTPEQPHPELCEPERWWGEMCARMQAALCSLGLPSGRCGTLAQATRERFLDTGVGWHLFPDVPAALDAVATAGWRSAILSNHVPELPQIAAELGLAARVEAIFSSATTGYEKPHPEAFGAALSALGRPQTVWMVGDDPAADVAGAEALGIPAILVRRDGEAARSAQGLAGAVEIMLAAG
jgi:putative hydrolase of the HAD superfamily